MGELERYFNYCDSVYFESARVQANFYRTGLYVLFGTSMLLVCVLSFLVVRRNRCLKLFNGRPGIIVPIHLVTEDINRKSFIALFVVISYLLFNFVLHKISPFEWLDTESHFVESLVVLFDLVFFACLSYPICVGLTSDSVPVLILTSLYTWAWCFVASVDVEICFHVYSSATSRKPLPFWPHQAIMLLMDIPVFISMFYLCSILPYRACKLIWCKPKTSAALLGHRSLSYQLLYVRALLDKKFSHFRNPKSRVTGKSKILVWLESKIYRPIPVFSYSLTVLLAVFVSIYLTFGICFFLINMYVAFVGDLQFFDENVNHTISKLAHKFNSTPVPELNEFVNRMSIEIPRNHQLLQEVIFWVRCLAVVFLLSDIIAFLCVATGLLCSLRNYRKNMLDLYKGCYANIPNYKNQKPRNIIAASAKFIGLQMGFACWGFLIQIIAIFAIIISIAAVVAFLFIFPIEAFKTFIIERLGVILLIYVFLFTVLQQVLIHLFFLLRDSNKKSVLAIDNRRAFANFQYFMIFLTAPLGVFTAILRLLKGLAVGIWILPRIDMSTLNREFESLDGAFSTYVSFLVLENSQNNPTLVAFVHLLCDSISLTQSQESEEGTADNTSLRHKLCRNRWNLYVTLINNSAVRGDRRGIDYEHSVTAESAHDL